jgi:hypothetical protein
MTNRNNRKLRNKTYLSFAQLEPRQCLSSVGWDGPGTGTAVLTYYVGPVPEGVDQATFDEVIEEALDVWAGVADVHFSKTDIPGLDGSLDFTFAELDGQGGMLANAYFPNDVNPEPYAGDVQFDLSESWEIGNGHGGEAFDLMYVAVHEIGHALGLEHAENDQAIMNALVEPDYQFQNLTTTDVEAIQQLYGRAGKETDGPMDPVREVVRDHRFAEYDLLRENRGSNAGAGTTGKYPLADSQLSQRPSSERLIRNDVLDQWASELEREQAADRSLIIESRQNRVVSVDLDSSLQSAELGSDLDGPIHDEMLSRHKLASNGASGLRT